MRGVANPPTIPLQGELHDIGELGPMKEKHAPAVKEAAVAVEGKNKAYAGAIAHIATVVEQLEKHTGVLTPSDARRTAVRGRFVDSWGGGQHFCDGAACCKMPSRRQPS